MDPLPMRGGTKAALPLLSGRLDCVSSERDGFKWKPGKGQCRSAMAWAGNQIAGRRCAKVSDEGKEARAREHCPPVGLSASVGAVTVLVRCDLTGVASVCCEHAAKSHRSSIEQCRPMSRKQMR